MPDPPNPKLRNVPSPEKPAGASALPYAELDVKTNFSFLTGASHPDELVYRAAELGYRAIAVTDFNSLAGVVRAHEAAKESGISLLIGSRLTFCDFFDLLVWAPDRAAYARLCRLLTLGKRRAQKGECALKLADFIDHSEGLLAAVVCSSDPILSNLVGSALADASALADFIDHSEGLPAAVNPISFSHRAANSIDAENSLEGLASLQRRSAFAPSPGTPGEGWGEGLSPAELRTLTLSLSRSTARGDRKLLLPDPLALNNSHGGAGLKFCSNSSPVGAALADASAQIAPFPTGVRQGGPYGRLPSPGKSVRGADPTRIAYGHLSDLKDALGDRLSLAASCAYGPDDATRLAQLRKLSRRFDIPLLATNDVYYHDPGRRVLQDVLTCIRHGCTIREAGFRLFPNGERYLKSPEQMHRLFADYPEAIRRGLEIAERCTFKLDELRYEYPDELVPAGKTAIEYLNELAWNGAATRYPAGIPEKVRGLLTRELALIEQLRFEHYFLTVHDLVTFARSRGILCQGRGSAANSAVCYCLGVTSVDPDRIDVLFERFISAARGEPPDIDVDFEHERREEVLQYLYNKYGRDRAAMTGVVITYRGRSAVRDVGKAMGLSLDMVDSLAGKLDWWHKGVVSAEQIRETGLDPADRTIGQVMALAGELLGFPRHLSQHVGGMVMTRGPLCELVPIENASMEDRTVIEWDKDDIDAIGILKVDVLALGMLTCISKALAMVNLRGGYPSSSPSPGTPGEGRGEGSFTGCMTIQNQKEPSPYPSPGVPGEGTRTKEFEIPSCSFVSFVDNSSCAPLELHTIPPEDPQVYDMICNADTVGVFQIESRAQMSMLPRLRPRCFYDLVIEVAIVRPGPIQGDMVHPYLRRRSGQEPVSFPSEALRQVLEKTLGVPLFQEQAMRVAMVGAGFTAEEADKLRRVMAAWRRTGAIETFHQKIVDGMLKNGYTPEFAEQCFNQIKGFGEYGFPESHSASFALLVYVSCWLKRHHPAAFAVALLNSQPMGFYQPAQIVRDAKEHGVEVRTVDVNASEWDCTLEQIAHGGRVRPPYLADKNAEGISSDVQYFGGDFRSPLPVLRERDRVRILNSDGSKDPHPNPLPEYRERGPEKSFASAKGNPTQNKFPQWGASGPALRLGFRELKGFRHDHATVIALARKKIGCFSSIPQFHRLTSLPVSAIRILAEADAFGSLGLCRRDALWQVMKLKDEHYPLFDTEPPEPQVHLPKMSVGQEVMTDYATAGLSLKRHPVSLVRDELRKRKIITAAELAKVEHNRWVKVAGLVLIRQRPGTASGVVFETLEDETGIINLILHPAIYDRYRPAARHAGLLQADGYVQRQGQIIHVLPKRLFDLSGLLGDYQQKSRDFH